MHTHTIPDLLANNRNWAKAKTAADPGFFHELASHQQHPTYLWLGCSDSRVPANDVVGVEPGEMFVHRNVANLAPAQDANFLAVLEFAVRVLEVRHVLVVGHYGCGGIRTAMENSQLRLVDHWLAPVRELIRDRQDEFDALAAADRHDRLCEWNVLRQVKTVAHNPFLLDAWARGVKVTIHGWCYSLETGLLKDLDANVSRPDDLSRISALR